MKDPLKYRNPQHVAAILDHLKDAPGPVPWLELIDTHTSDTHPWRTVEATLYDLCQYGAAHRVGSPATRNSPDTRALRLTNLGAAWLDQQTPPLPGAHTT